MIDKNKDSQSQSLAELQQELKSLKALLLNRGPSLSSGASTPLLSFSGRPSIPAWQLAGAGNANGVQSSEPSISTASYPDFTTPTVPNGKGKEVEGPEASGSS
jgi:peroxin-14